MRRLAPVFTAMGKENVNFVLHIQPLRLTRTTHTQKKEMIDAG